MKNSMLDIINTYRKQAETLIPEWKTYIVDQSKPLDDRWASFLAAPVEWRQEYSSSDVPLDAAASKFNSPYDHFHMDLEQTMTVQSLFSYLEEYVSDGDFTEEQLAACKEEAIQKNLGLWWYTH